MRRLTALLLVLGLMLVIASCSGASIPPNYFDEDNNGLPDLEWDLVTDPGSSPSADEVDGEMMTVDDALDAKAPSALPSGYQSIQGMYFTPLTPPGAGFSGQLSVRITMGNPIPNEYNGVRLFLYYIDPSTREASIMDSARGRAGNWVTFSIDALGFFVVAENLAIPRPGTAFSVSAFADLAQTTAGTLINFWAVPNNGTPPYTYAWTFGDGGTGAGAQTTHTYNSPGTYNVQVIATDADGNTAPADSTPIEITASPNPLTDLTVTVTPDSADHLSFSYAATISGGTGPFSYSWDFDGDGAEDSSAAPPTQYTFSTEGLYGGRLTVIDSLGDSISADLVSDARRLLLETENTLGYEPYDVTFSLVALGFAPGDPLEVVFGDGETDPAPGGVVVHTYLTEGTFNAFAMGVSTLDGLVYPLQSEIVSIVVNKLPRPVVQLTQPIVAQGVSSFTIYGFNLGATQGASTLTYDGSPLTVLSWSATAITAEIPAAPSSASGVLQLATDLAEAPPINLTLDSGNIPIAVQNVLPRQVTPDGLLLVVGHGFSAGGTLTLGGGNCTVLHWDDNGIVATAPAGIVAGPALLSVNAGAPPLQADFDCEVVAGTAANPVVNSVNPYPYELGTGGVVLSGSGFGDGLGGLVFAEGQVIPTINWADATVVLNDPANPVDSVGVLLNLQNPSAPFDLTMIKRPVISTVEPDFAAIGETIVITGLNFGVQAAGDRVLLNSNELLVASWTDTEIVAQITDGSDDGDLVVAKKLSSNAVPFTVVPPAPGPPGGGQT